MITQVKTIKINNNEVYYLKHILLTLFEMRGSFLQICPVLLF